MKCEKCGKLFEEDWRRDRGLKRREPTPRFCSRACANSKIFSEESRAKKSQANQVSEKFKEAIKRRKEAYLARCSLLEIDKPSKKKRQYRTAKLCLTCGKLIPSNIGRKTCSEECYRSFLSKSSLERQVERHHSRKDILYRGVILNSSYEETVAKSLDQEGILWERPKPLRWKDQEGVDHYYYPDFFLPEYNVFLDPKNDYLIHNVNKWFGITDKEKIEKVEEQNGVRILILSKKDLLWEKIQALLS